VVLRKTANHGTHGKHVRKPNDKDGLFTGMKGIKRIRIKSPSSASSLFEIFPGTREK
jgi:hypothetical protein